jgi:hypothetical protein
MCPREKKGLKIPNGSSESVNPRRTDNTMAKRKSTKGQKKTYKHTHKTPRAHITIADWPSCF